MPTTQWNQVPSPAGGDQYAYATQLAALAKGVNALVPAASQAARNAILTAAQSAGRGTSATPVAVIRTDLGAIEVYNGSAWLAWYPGLKVVTGTRNIQWGTPQTSQTLAQTFPVPFASAPVVIPTIRSGASATGSWHVRAINVTASGFDWFVFGPSSAWATAQPLDYVAVGL